jgi:DNA-binding IclR family transcriptional regulator
MLCGWVLARAHSKVSDKSSTISGYLGASSDAFDEAMGRFAVAYADQAERDHAALKAAVKKGKITVYQEA